MTNNNDRTISDYGLMQHELELWEAAPLSNQDEISALFLFDPEKLGLDRFCRPAAEAPQTFLN